MVGSVRGLFSLFAVVAFGGVATAVGCGSEDSPTREYREMASALCRDALRDAEELLLEYTTELLEIGKRDNELSRRLGLPDCVTPLPGPDGQPPAPA